MKLSLLGSKTAIVGLAAALLLGSTVPLGGSVDAATLGNGGAAGNAALVATNNPHIYAFASPPATFDATKASAAELASYGLPARPDASRYPTQYRQWLQLVSEAKHNVVPSFTPRPDLKFNKLSSNWSGTVNTGPINTFQSVQGMWNVPSMHFPVEAGSDAAVWVGLDGGFVNGQVEQMGTDTTATCQTINHVYHCYPSSFAWAELYPDGPQQIQNFPVSSGDLMGAVVTFTKVYIPTVGLTPVISFYMADDTKGTYTSFAWVAQKYGCPCQTAEWIVERAQPNLFNFGSLTLFDEVAWTQSQTYYYANSGSNPFNPTLVSMWNPSTNHLLDTVSAVNDFTDQFTWLNFN